jgi:copper homeostasis protein
MLEDVDAIRGANAAAVVFGCLDADGCIDEARTAILVNRARPLSVTVHRAFDMTRDPAEALEALIRCGVDRVLTSGQCPDAVTAIPALRRLNEQAAGRIIVLGCGGLRPDTIGQVVRETGLVELHFSALVDMPSPMRHRNASLGMGRTDLEREYRRTVTDADLVARTIEAARGG